jgi:hypothetical protein
MSKDIEKEKQGQEKGLILSASALLRKDFPEPKWIVQDILPKGSLSIMASRPKAGKTFLALQLALSVALGRLFITKRTEKVPILFLSYELNQRQMQKRISLLLERFGISTEEAQEMGGEKFPLFLSFASRLKGVQGLRHLLELFEKRGVKIELVFIDTYVLFKDLGEQAKKEGKTAYELESEYLAGLRKLCEEKEVSVVLIYHNRKKQAISGDITEEVMGSTGITGAVNNLFLLDRKTGEREAYLNITGHDIEEQNIELTFEKGYFKVRTITDKEQEVIDAVITYLKQVGGEAIQQRILDYLKNVKRYRSIGEVKDILEKYSQIREGTPTYWYCVERKREYGRPNKVYSLNPPVEVKQGKLINDKQENENDLQERKKLVERIEALLSEKVISPDEFPEKLEEYGVYNFETLIEKIEEIPLSELREFVERLEAYRPQEDWNFAEIDDEEYGFEF